MKSEEWCRQQLSIVDRMLAINGLKAQKRLLEVILN